MFLKTNSSDANISATTSADRSALEPFHRHVARSCMTFTCAQLATLNNAYESTEENEQQFERLPPPLRERFDPNFYHSDGIYLRATGEPYESGVQRLLFDQLRAEKHFLTHTLQTTKKELQRSAGHYSSLESLVKSLFDVTRDEDDFVMEYARNVLTLHRLQKLQKKLSTSNEQETIQPPLFDQCTMWNALRLRFNLNWEHSRQAQQQQKCRSIEHGFRARMAETQQRIDYEIRCKVEMDMFMGNTIEMMSQDCVKWMDKFDADYEAAEVDIQVATEQLDELHKTREDLQAQYDKRVAVVEEFYRKKEEKEAFERCLIKYTKNAMIIQIWFRAFMVRYGLGPYKRKKPKKKKK